VPAEQDLLRWILIWLAAAGFLLVRHGRSDAGAGLMFSYVLMFGVLHWVGPAMFLLPWHDQRGVIFTVEGLRLASIAMLALAAGSEVVVWASRGTRLSRTTGRVPPPVDTRLVNLYFVTGALLYLVVMPFASLVPSLTALVSTGTVLVVVAMGLHCRSRADLAGSARRPRYSRGGSTHGRPTARAGLAEMGLFRSQDPRRNG
jgi:hypothetical protein